MPRVQLPPSSNDPARDDDRSSQELLDRWQKEGDTDALDELLRAEVDVLAKKLRAHARARMSGAASATDLAQEAVLRLLRLEEAPEFASPDALRAYLWTAAWRLLVNRMQRPGRDVVRLSDGGSRSLSGFFGRSGGFGALEQADQRTALEVIVNLLRDEDREVLSLVYFQELSIDDVAKRLGVSRAAIDMRLTRARRKLAEKLVDWADVVG
jgi:RNA polymerase sigma factor (sigma-70 family)